MLKSSSGTIAIVLLLAGCLGGGMPKEPTSVDGQAALDWTAGLLTHPNGSPRFRVPGTDAHAEAGTWLWEAMQVTGWTRHRQPFSGAEYLALNKGQAAFFADHPGYCSSDEKARLGNLTFENFWAVYDNPNADRLVLLGAHWESKANASDDPSQAVLGANDGAAGVGLLLEFMRHIQSNKIQLPFDLGVVFFDGEDGFEECHPLAGSIYFVSQLQAGQVDRLVLLDMIGDADARFIRESYSYRCDPSLVDLFWDLAPRHKLEQNFGAKQASMYDDHLPFIEAGIPAIDIIDNGRGFPPYWHTTQDTLDKLSPVMLGRMGDLVLDVLQDERFTATWPTSC